MMCEDCFNDVVLNPEQRIMSMQKRLKKDFSHWVHYVRADREPNSEYLMSWANNADRRCKTFTELEENSTPTGTYAYDHIMNRYTQEDKRQMRKHASRYQASGSGGYDRHYDRDNKRRRRR